MNRYLNQTLRVGVFALVSASAVMALVATAQAEVSDLSPAKLPAFPGAQGYGSLTHGGRGGKVIPVANLNDTGPGSLRAAVETEGPRIVVFRVSGTIKLQSPLRIRRPHITIAGQTAPGDGICLRDQPLVIGADDVIIRYLRVRLGDESAGGADAVEARYNKNLMLDHISASWGSDEVLSVYHGEFVTVQNSIISEAIGDGTGHKFGGIWGCNYSTYHHNLIAHNDSRNPRWASGSGYVDYRNNVLYNWGYNSSYGGEAHQRGDRRNPPVEFSHINMVANYYKSGPATRSNVSSRIVGPSTRDGATDAGKWWVSDNAVKGSPEVTADNWLGVSPSVPEFRLAEPWPAMPINEQSAEEAFKTVLAHAGASLPKRDSVDARIIEEVRNGTATYGEGGIISSPSDVGGWPELKSAPAPKDTSGNGIPDWWLERYGLDIHNPDVANEDLNGTGYTNIEEYLNGTDPAVFVDYTKPENNVNTLNTDSFKPAREHSAD
jgi:hypothetical protein